MAASPVNRQASAGDCNWAFQILLPVDVHEGAGQRSIYVVAEDPRSRPGRLRMRCHGTLSPGVWSTVRSLRRARPAPAAAAIEDFARLLADASFVGLNRDKDATLFEAVFIIFRVPPSTPWSARSPETPPAAVTRHQSPRLVDRRGRDARRRQGPTPGGERGNAQQGARASADNGTLHDVAFKIMVSPSLP